jgi:hypothetical protein
LMCVSRLPDRVACAQARAPCAVGTASSFRSRAMAYAVLPSVRSRTTRATTSSGVERGSAYWQAGWDWIAAQREPLGKLLEADSAAADAVAAATRRLEEQRAEPPTREPKWPIVRVVEPSAARPLAADASSSWPTTSLACPITSSGTGGTARARCSCESDIGRIAIQTHADSGDRVVSDVHAGFGVSLSLDLGCGVQLFRRCC